jgi:hypothetical protein
MKKFAFAAFATVACVGFVMAEDMTVIIQKVDAKAGTITYKKGGFGGGKFKKEDAPPAETKTATVAKGAKIANGEINFGDKSYKALDSLTKGLEDPAFTANEKGTFARITIADEDKGDVKKGQVTQILVIDFKGLKGFKKDK